MVCSDGIRRSSSCPSALPTRRRFVGLACAAGACALAGALPGFPQAAAAATPASATVPDGVDFSDWDAVLAAARGQEVFWYGWGGDDARNSWIEGVLAPRLKERYDVKLTLVGMDINDILTLLSGEKQAGVEQSAVDFIWINGENFASARANGYLWGPFADYLPNYRDFCDADAPDIAFDFGSPVEGFEAPYAKAQLCLWVDGAQVPEPPRTPDELLRFCQEHPGMVTYPEPGDFTGTAFVSSVIAGVVGKEEFERLSAMPDATVDEVRAVVEPGLAFLRALNPYLWKGGATFPADSTTLRRMFADGELVLGMCYGEPQTDVDRGVLPPTTRSFVLDSGTVGNTNYMAVAARAPHKAAALVAINEVMSPEMQLEQYRVLGNITVLDLKRLPAEQRAAFEQVELGSAQIPLADKLAVRVAEAAGPVIPLIEQLWLDEVPGK